MKRLLLPFLAGAFEDEQGFAVAQGLDASELVGGERLFEEGGGVADGGFLAALLQPAQAAAAGADEEEQEDGGF